MIENQHNKVRVYSRGGTNNSVFHIWRSIFSDYRITHSLGYRLASRNIKARYKQSVFGLLLAFVAPLATAALWIILNKQKIVSFPDAGMPYPVFVITGTTLWLVFSNSLTLTLQTVSANSSILTKVNFPREAILINAFYEILFNVLIGLLIIIGVLVFSGNFNPVLFITHLPFILLLILIGMTVSLYFLPFSLLFKDIQALLPTVLQLFMYLSPVLYPRPAAGRFDWIYKYNPVSIALQYIRSGFAGHVSESEYLQIAVVFMVFAFLFAFGLILYRITMEVLIERMNG